VLANHCKGQEEVASHLMPHAEIMPRVELDEETFTFAKKERAEEREFSVVFGSVLFSIKCNRFGLDNI